MKKIISLSVIASAVCFTSYAADSTKLSELETHYAAVQKAHSEMEKIREDNKSHFEEIKSTCKGLKDKKSTSDEDGKLRERCKAIHDEMKAKRQEMKEKMKQHSKFED